MFITGLSIIAKKKKRKNGNNLNVHKQADRLKKSWYIYKVEYYIGNQTHKKIHIDIERYPSKKM